MDEQNTLINNSEAGELIENNSQWHPGFSTLGSVPGTHSTGTLPPTLEPTAQASAASIADQDFLTEDEAEVEDEADEEMDEIDDVDDAFDEDAMDDDEEADSTAFEVTSTNEANPQSLLAAISTEVDHLLSDDNLFSEAEDSELPELEEMFVAQQTDQQTAEGNG